MAIAHSRRQYNILICFDTLGGQTLPHRFVSPDAFEESVRTMELGKYSAFVLVPDAPIVLKEGSLNDCEFVVGEDHTLDCDVVPFMEYLNKIAKKKGAPKLGVVGPDPEPEPEIPAVLPIPHAKKVEEIKPDQPAKKPKVPTNIKLVKGRAKKIEIPASVASMAEDEDVDDITEVLERLNSKKVLAYLAKQNIKRGDIVHIGTSDYRNDGCFIFDGESIVPLHTDYDDYGCVPPEFTVIGEFPVNYWSKVVAHNYLVWFDSTNFSSLIEKHAKPVKKGEPGELKAVFDLKVNGQDVEFTFVFDDTHKNDVLAGGPRLWNLDGESYSDAARGDTEPPKFFMNSTLFLERCGLSRRCSS